MCAATGRESWWSGRNQSHPTRRTNDNTSGVRVTCGVRERCLTRLSGSPKPSRLPPPPWQLITQDDDNVVLYCCVWWVPVWRPCSTTEQWTTNAAVGRPVGHRVVLPLVRSFPRQTAKENTDRTNPVTFKSLKKMAKSFLRFVLFCTIF